MESLVRLVSAYPDQVTALSTLGAVLVSLLAIFVSVHSLRMQREHNIKSLRPIASITQGDYEDRLTVKLTNVGVGPMLIDRVTVQKGDMIFSSVIDAIGDDANGVIWRDFSGDFSKRWLSPNDSRFLIHLEGDPHDPDFRRKRDAIRKALSQCEVRVESLDVYDQRQSVCKQELKWFARTL